MSGAEKLLGKGDMLFYPASFMKPVRIQGAYISEKEVENLVSFIKDNSQSSYNKEVIQKIECQETENKKLEEHDELLEEAIDLVIGEGQASVSYIQRKLKVGYARAGRIVDEMEEMNVVGPYEGSKPRKVLTTINPFREEDVKNEHS